MEDPTPSPMALFVGLFIIAIGVALAFGQPAYTGDQTLVAAPVPTLQPTPALAVLVAPPAPAPTAPPAVYIQRNEGSVTVNQTNIEVNVCVGLCR